MRRIAALLLGLAVMDVTPAIAHSYLLKALMIGHAHMAPPVKGMSQVIFPLYNGGSQADRLIAATSPQVRYIRFVAADGKAVLALELPPHKAIAMRNDATHLILEGIQPGLKPGARIPLTLTFAQAGTLKIEVFVEAPDAGSLTHL